MQSQDPFKTLYEKVSRLTFSEISTYELMDFANEACSLVSASKGAGETSAQLARLRQIKDQGIRPLLEEEVVLTDRIKIFQESKSGLESSLTVLFS